MATLLFADDDPVAVHMHTACLRHDGHTVLTAFDGEEALSLIRQERPDLVVLDVNMPHLDGFRVLHRVREDSELCRTLIVMLTAHGAPEEVRLGLELGADCYLTKPVHPEELSALIRRLLQAGAPSVSPDPFMTVA